MQNSPYEIKEKLLRALDQEYNVVDMAAVFEVISALEKACITREALERTRIGKYINELRKRTSNEQLAKRAKELVKSWRKLLPPSEGSINGEKSIYNLGTLGVTVLGPGPGPGFGPGPGPGNRTPNSNVTSPSLAYERCASPFCSSASSSPQLTTNKLQGSNRPSNSSENISSKLNYASIRADKAMVQPKTVLTTINLDEFHSQKSNQSLDWLRSSTTSNSAASTTSQQNPLSSSISHDLNCSRSCSPHLDSSAMSAAETLTIGKSKMSPRSSVSPPISSGSAHSSLEIAKTNAANKRLRKEDNVSSNKVVTRKSNMQLMRANDIIGNGMDITPESAEKNLNSENAAFRNFNLSKNNKSVQGDRKNTVKTEKKKRVREALLSPDPLKDKICALGVGAKLPKVKTTQQLIEELQARKEASNRPFPKITLPTCDLSLGKTTNNLYDISTELYRSKSELMDKFLSSYPESPSVNSSHGSHTAKFDEPLPLENCESHVVPDKSVIIVEKGSPRQYLDPVTEEINQILSTLPPINPEEIDFEEEPLPERKLSVTDDDVERLLSEQWENVNGNYSSDGTWRFWNECVEINRDGEPLRILPYVNIE